MLISLLSAALTGALPAPVPVPIPVLPNRAAARLRDIARTLQRAADGARTLADAYQRVQNDVSPERVFRSAESADAYAELAHEIRTDFDAGNDPMDLRRALDEYYALADDLREPARYADAAEERAE